MPFGGRGKTDKAAIESARQAFQSVSLIDVAALVSESQTNRSASNFAAGQRGAPGAGAHDSVDSNNNNDEFESSMMGSSDVGSAFASGSAAGASSPASYSSSAPLDVLRGGGGSRSASMFGSSPGLSSLNAARSPPKRGTLMHSDTLTSLLPSSRSRRRRARFQDKGRGLDLDLSFITDRVVAMSMPTVNSQQPSSSSSNSHSSGAGEGHTFTEVVRFFGSQKFKVYNLCDEARYNPRAMFKSTAVSFAEYPVNRRKPPSLKLLRKLVVDMQEWLDQHPQNVAVVHCSSGLGRTCVAVSSYLIFAKHCKTASEALQLFARKRLVGLAPGLQVDQLALDEATALAVQSPSQQRYVMYFEKLLALASMARPSWELAEKPQILFLQEIVMNTVPNFRVMGGCEPWFAIFQNGRRIFISDPQKERRKTKTKDKSQLRFPCFDISIAGDISIEFYHKRITTKMFAISCHTSFLQMSRHSFPKREIDAACKDRACERFAPNFRVDLMYKTKEENDYEKIQARAVSERERQAREAEESRAMAAAKAIASRTLTDAAMTIDVAPRPSAKGQNAVFGTDKVPDKLRDMRGGAAQFVSPAELERNERMMARREAAPVSFSVASDVCPVCKDAIFSSDDVVTTITGQTHWGCVRCHDCGQKLSELAVDCTIIDGFTGEVRCPNCVAGRSSDPRRRDARAQTLLQSPAPAGGVERANRAPGVTLGPAGNRSMAARTRGRTLANMGLGNISPSFFPGCQKCGALVVEDLYGSVPDDAVGIISDSTALEQRREQIRLQQSSLVTDPNAVWHARCFNCVVCSENVLFGSRAVIVGEDVYCTTCVRSAGPSSSSDVEDVSQLVERLQMSQASPAGQALTAQRKFLTQLLCGEVVPLAKAGTLTVEQLEWLFEWAMNDERAHVNEAAVMALSLCAFPKETIPGIREKILDCQLLDLFVHYASQGVIHVHPEISTSEVTMGQEIAAGAGGVVFKAVWTSRDQPSVDVALKLFLPDHIAFDELVFRRETAIASMLAHPFIVTCPGASFQRENMFLVSEWMTDGSLRDLRQKRPSLLEEHAVACGIAVDICEAMIYLHDHNIIHRDLKPDNILFTKGTYRHHSEIHESATASELNLAMPAHFPMTPYHRRCRSKLTDFGTSRSIARDRPMSGNVGTTRYIAPELFNEPYVYDELADVYSFAILLWEILFPRDASFGTIPAYRIPEAVGSGLRPAIPPERLVLESKKLGSTVRDVEPHPELTRLLKQCWQSNPKLRPPFTEIQSRLIKLEVELFEARKQRVRAAEPTPHAAPAPVPEPEPEPEDDIPVVEIKSVILPPVAPPFDDDPFELEPDDAAALDALIETHRPPAAESTTTEDESFGPRCVICSKQTGSSCVMLGDKPYHNDCFRCAQCNKLLSPGDPVGLREGKHYCKDDYYQLWKQCDRCGKLLTGTFLSVPISLERNVESIFHYHPHCLICTFPGCKVPLPDGVFYEVAGNTLCSVHMDAKPPKATLEVLAPATVRVATTAQSFSRTSSSSDLKAQIAILQVSKESAAAREDFDEAHKLKVEIDQLESQLAGAKGASALPPSSPVSIPTSSPVDVPKSASNRSSTWMRASLPQGSRGSDAFLAGDFAPSSLPDQDQPNSPDDNTVQESPGKPRLTRVHADNGTFKTVAILPNKTVEELLPSLLAKFLVPEGKRGAFRLVALLEGSTGDEKRALTGTDLVFKYPSTTSLLFTEQNVGSDAHARTPIGRTPSQARVSMQTVPRPLLESRQAGGSNPSSPPSSSSRWKTLKQTGSGLIRSRTKTQS